MHRVLVSASLVLVFILAASAQVPASGLPLEGAEAEEFLRSAEVIDLRYLEGQALTRPQRATLSDGNRTVRALFKTINEDRAKVKLSNGETITNFKDSYYNEIAAYKLDRLLGLGVVPPCVKRRVGAKQGSMCLWVEGAMTEWERDKEKKLRPPDIEAWNRQMHTIRLFLQLTYDFDYLNTRNLLIDEDWKIYKIDSSRSFRNEHKLRDPSELERFSRAVLESLRQLDADEVQTALKESLSKPQIKGLLARRDLILEVAEQRVAEKGEEAVLYP
jgi:hypothetical protein